MSELTLPHINSLRAGHISIMFRQEGSREAVGKEVKEKGREGA